MSRLMTKRARRWAVVVALVVGGGALALAAGTALTSRASASPTCTIYWTGSTDSDWGTDTNWSLTDGGSPAGLVPGPSDFVCMSTSPTTATVDLSSTTTSVIGGINFSAAGAVSPDLTIDGSLTLGSTTVVDPSTLDQVDDEGTLIGFAAEAATVADLTLNGTLEGPGGFTVAGAAALDAGSVLGVNGVSADAVQLVTQGATSITGTGGESITFDSGSVLENQGTVTLSDNADLADGDGQGNQVINDHAATITYTGSTTNAGADINVGATNNGIVSVGEGTLGFGELSAGVTDTGSFSVSAGATLDLAGTRSEGSGATIGGSGTVDVVGSTTLSAATNVANSTSLQVDGTLQAGTGVAVSVADLTLNGTLEGPGGFTVAGAAALDAGSVLGVNGVSADAVQLVTQGATSITGTGGESITFDSGSVLENQGTVTLSDNADLADGDGQGNQVINDHAATITYTGSTTNVGADINVGATNNGIVSVGEGTLGFGELSAGVTDTGSFSVSAGATLDLAGTRSEGSGATIGGSGTVDVVGSTTLSAATNVANSTSLQVDGTLQAGTGVAVSVADLTLNGTLEGPGGFTVAGAAALDAGSVLGVNGVSADAVQLVTQGATSITGTGGESITFDSGSVLENQGTVTLSDNADLADGDGQGNQVINDHAATITYTGSKGAKSATIDVAVDE